MKNLNFYILLLLFWVSNLEAQNSNYWVSNNYYSNRNIYFDNNGNIKIDTLNNLVNPCNAICNSRGNVQFYLLGNSIVNSNLEYILNSKTKIPNFKNYILPFNEGRFKIIKSYDSTESGIENSLLINPIRYSDGIYISNIELNNNIYSVSKLDSKFLNKNIHDFAVSRKNDSTYFAVCNTTDFIYSFLIFWNSTKLVDSVKVERFNCIKDSIRNNISITKRYFSNISLSHDCSSLILSNQSSSYYSLSQSGIYSSSQFGSGCCETLKYEIDINTNKFKNSTLIDYYSNSSKIHSGINPVLYTYSPNSKILYGFKTSDTINNLYLFQDIWQYDLNSINPINTKKIIFRLKNKKSNDTIFSFVSFPKLSPYGLYTFLTFEYLLKFKKRNFISNVIKNCNSFTPLSSIIVSSQKFFDKDYKFDNFINILHNHIYDYVKIKHVKEQLGCEVKVKFKNNSDTCKNFNMFKYIITFDKNRFDTLIGFEPQIIINKNGKFPYKVIGYGEFNYTEIYEDTIIITSINKPEILDLIYPKQVCRYDLFTFKSKIIRNDNSRFGWVWKIEGFGNVYSDSFVHYFKDTGKYKIVLFFWNSNCSDTFIGEPIRVVDAPKPGFSVLYKQGCAPFIAQFTDTTILNVQQKDYWISDGSGWKNIPIAQPNFTHTFAKAGVYKATQRLIGFSGCVIMQDSVIFNISKGLTASDTLNLINGTILNPSTPYGNANTINFPLLWWHKLDGAVQYQIFKNGSNLSIVSDTFLQENKAYLADANYSVVGIDSCGNKSSAGRISKPMFLQATMIGNNEASLVQFSPYLQWQGNSIIYQLQKLITGNWQTVNAANSNTNYTDNQFLNFSEVQACYRVQAKESSMPTIETYSNEICIPYIPTIYVPTAFTPNDDGVNDVFDVTGFGIQNYNITIYNRWGEQIFAGANKQAWNGSNAADGIYVARIEFVTNKGIKLNQRVTVTLLK